MLAVDTELAESMAEPVFVAVVVPIPDLTFSFERISDGGRIDIGSVLTASTVAAAAGEAISGLSFKDGEGG